MGRSLRFTKPKHPNIPINFGVVSWKRTRRKQTFCVKSVCRKAVIYDPSGSGMRGGQVAGGGRWLMATLWYRNRNRQSKLSNINARLDITRV